MPQLLIINWTSIAMIISCAITFVVVMLIASFCVADMQKKKFDVEYETLKDFIHIAPIDKENYQAICDMFNETYCYSDDNMILIKHLWFEFQFKFRDISPLNIKNQSLEEIAEMNKNHFSRCEELKPKSIVEPVFKS